MISDFEILFRAIMKMLYIWSPAILPTVGMLLYLEICKGLARRKREEGGIFIDTYIRKEKA